MGQMPSIDTISFAAEPLKRLKNNLTVLSKNEKTVKVLICDKKFSFTYKEGVTKVANLLKQVRKVCSSIQLNIKVVAFRSETGAELLDYYLSSQKFLLQHLDGATLKVVESILPDSNDPLASFTPLKTLGKGGFSIVTLVRKNSSGQLFALKSLNKDHIISSSRISNILSERRILSKLAHPFILTLQCSFQTAQYLHMVLDFCPGGELFYLLKRVGKLNEPQALFYFAEIMLALEYLHNNNIIYRDLKPENVLIDFDGHIKLVDFGTSREGCNEERRFTYCGSAEYMSPEMIQKTGHGKSLDCFSLGSLLYELLAGVPPFYHENKETMFWKIQNEPLEMPKFLSVEVKDLLRGLLDKDPNMRIGSEFISDIKDHPWCAKIHWKKMIKKKISPPILPSFSNSNFDPIFTNIPINSEIFFEPCITPNPSDIFQDFDYFPNHYDTEIPDYLLDLDDSPSDIFINLSNSSEKLEDSKPTTLTDRITASTPQPIPNSDIKQAESQLSLHPKMSKMKEKLHEKLSKY